MVLPEAFVKTVSSTFGEGSVWLTELPTRIREIEAIWGLEALPAYPNLSYNYVCPARLNSGESVVLKLGLPNDELTSEIKALELYNGKGIARLLQNDKEKGALLLEKLEPGVSFWKSDDDDLATRVCAELLQDLWLANIEGSEFRTLESWSQALVDYHAEHSSTHSIIPWELVDKAIGLRRELLQNNDTVLLHADLHHDNILSAERQAYLAIDPKGIAGQRGYDIASFLVNPAGFDKHPDLKKRLARRIDIFSEALNLSAEELIAWGVMHCILSSCWSFGTTGVDDAPHIIAEALNTL